MSSTPAEDKWQSDLNFEHELKSVVDKILQACPKFRILVLGRSGVGKSHLINAVFGTNDTVVEHGRKAGVSAIEQEFTSQNPSGNSDIDSDIEQGFTPPQNPRLILHDSQGFSHGSANNLNVVQEFIKRRSQMANLEDRLHAICFDVPTYGGSLLEVAEERILQLKDRGVPILAVLTKYDDFVGRFKPADDDFYGDIQAEIENLDKAIDLDMCSTTGDQDPIDPSTLSCAEEELREMIKPFEKMLGVPWVAVSVKPGFASTLDELVTMTQERIDRSLELLWAITQQRSVNPKIKASIEIGKQRYWRGLSTSLVLGGKLLAKWFKVVHQDVLRVWGLYDPKKVLILAAKEMSELQQGLVEEEGRLVQSIPLGAVTTAAGVISVAFPPAALIAVPIAAGLVFAAWVYNVVDITPNVLRGMMGYIVDLTIVMQSLFFLMQARTQALESASPVNERLFKLALDAYKQDTEHSLWNVHEEIRSFATRKNAFFKSRKVIEEVERLISVHRFKPSERFMEEAKANTGSF